MAAGWCWTSETWRIGLEVGASLSVNGVCLTAVEVEDQEVTAEVVAETLRRSNLGSVRPGDRVNLERPLRADGRFDGHIVQGHVDATGEVIRVEPEGDGRLIQVGAAIGRPPLHGREGVDHGRWREPHGRLGRCRPGSRLP